MSKTPKTLYNMRSIQSEVQYVTDERAIDAVSWLVNRMCRY